MPRKKKLNEKDPINDTVDKKAFGKRISRLMVENGYTNEMLAERIGVSISSIIALKAGERLPGLDNYLRLLEAFNTCDLVLLQDSFSESSLKCTEIIDKEILPLLYTLDFEELSALYEVIKPLVLAIKKDKNGREK